MTDLLNMLGAVAAVLAPCLLVGALDALIPLPAQVEDLGPWPDVVADDWYGA